MRARDRRSAAARRCRRRVHGEMDWPQPIRLRAIQGRHAALRARARRSVRSRAGSQRRRIRRCCATEKPIRARWYQCTARARISRHVRSQRSCSKNLARLLEWPATIRSRPTLAERRGSPIVREAYRAVHAPKTRRGAACARALHLRRVPRARGGRATAPCASASASTTRARLRNPADLLERVRRQHCRFRSRARSGASIHEIWHDMTRDVPMNRLLQGDVGSGKTLVAAAAIVLAARNGVQSALMAPTEILAAQHARNSRRCCCRSASRVEAVFGSQAPARAQRGARERLASGEACVAVGTHALLTEGVEFARLGLVIIDEQHRFGVEQRARLRAKAWRRTRCT